MGATSVAPIWFTYTLALDNGLDGAVVSAGAAVDAQISSDLVMIIAGSDGFDGAVAGAQTAGNAFVSNLVCHLGTPPFWDRSPIYFIVAWIFKKAILFYVFFSDIWGNVLKKQKLAMIILRR